MPARGELPCESAVSEDAGAQDAALATGSASDCSLYTVPILTRLAGPNNRGDFSVNDGFGAHVVRPVTQRCALGIRTFWHDPSIILKCIMMEHVVCFSHCGYREKPSIWSSELDE